METPLSSVMRRLPKGLRLTGTSVPSIPSVSIDAAGQTNVPSLR